MSDWNNTLPAKYKNTQIYVTQESWDTYGSRWIKHEYPDSNIQYMESLGDLPNNFTVDIIFFGATYQEDFANFRSLCDDIPGSLVMPTWGLFNNMVAVCSPAVHNYNEFNSITTTVTFSVTVAMPSTTVVTGQAEDVYDSGATATITLQENLADTLQISETLNNAVTLALDVLSVIAQVQSVVGFGQIIGAYYQSISAAISSPQKIANLLLGPGNLLNYIYTNYTSPTAYNDYAGLTSMGNNLPITMYEINQNITQPARPLLPGQTVSYIIPNFPNITVEQQQRNSNRNAIVNALRLWAIIMMCESALTATFNTAQDVQNALIAIGNIFNLIIEQDQTGVLIPSMKIYMEDVFNKTFAVLNNLENTLPNVQTINVNMPISAAQLAVELWGEYIQNENDLNYWKSLLIQLNPHQSPAFLQGAVNIIGVS